ncbi:hypothetical protein AAC387_Pa07g0375 [Persea americana]
MDQQSLLGKVSYCSMTMAREDFYGPDGPGFKYRTRLVLNGRDSNKSITGAATAAFDLMNSSKVQAIIGPQTSEQADFLAYMAQEAHIPIISFSAVSSSLPPSQVKFFVRMAQHDSTQALPIAALVQAFGWREVVIIHDDSDSGIVLIPYLTDAFQEIDVKVRHRLVLKTTKSSINKTLHKITKQIGTRVFIVHLPFSLSKWFFMNVHKAGMMEKDYVWIITSELTNCLCYMDSSIFKTMQGVLGVQTFVPESERLDDFKVRWKRRLRRQFPDIEILDLDAYSLWAYDTVWLLAMAAEKTSFQLNQPFNSPNSQNLMGEPGYYDDLIYQVNRKKFDAVVGDTTIIANRSIYVDFTQPYAESGVSMIVPIQYDYVTKSRWWYTKPFKWNLWLAIFLLCGAKGFLVWLFERKDNIEEFGGEWHQQLGIIFHFSFSLLVFAQREKLKTNYSRVVVVVWTLLVFLIVTSYNANLTAMLTVEKLQPAITDMNSLIRNGDYVGYPNASFLLEHLKHMGFSEDKLRPYATVDEYADALSRGSSNNGVSAIVDEIPYIKIFLKKYCDKYTMAGQTSRTGGFGFVFPKGFDMVPDVSRAVLNLSESSDMSDIQNKWFGSGTTCPDSLDTPITDKKLSWIAFLTAFAIAGGIALFALGAFLSEDRWKPCVERLISKVSQNLRQVFQNLRRPSKVPPTSPPPADDQVHQPQQEATTPGTAPLEPTPSHINGDPDNSNNGERRADSARRDDGSSAMEAVPANDAGGHEIIEGEWAKTVAAKKIDVGVILDQQSLLGKVSNCTMAMAREDFYDGPGYNYQTRVVLNGRDSNKSIIGVASAAFDLMNGSEVQALIGPQTSEQADFLADMGEEAHIPIISFSAVKSSLSPSQVPFFVRMAQNDSTQAMPIAALVKAFGWGEVVIIHDDSDSGTVLIPYLTDAFQEIDVKARHRLVLSSTTSSINNTLRKITEQIGTRVFIVHLPFSLSKRFFINVHKAGMMAKDFVWIITSELTNRLCYMNSSILNTMQGVLGVQTFVPESERLNDFKVRWKRRFRRQFPDIEILDLDAYSLWAYDTVWLVAMAAEKTSFQFNEKFNSPNSQNLKSLFELDVSPNVSLEYYEFDKDHAGEPGYYDNLIYQVYLKKYDAVVGDTTIIANRSIYVDFTQPYAESGVSMIVPIQRDYVTKSLWWFTKPFTWNLWLTIFLLCGAKGLLVWLFERSYKNEDFGGEWHQQLGIIFHFSFSVLVFAQREKLKTNYSRVVVVVWTLLVFLVVTSYTANLTAMLTVEKMQPAITDINSLIRRGDYVGYPNASFLLEDLKHMGFSEDKLRPYATIGEYADALSRGSSNNGVSAIVDEIPYIKIFLKKYCHKYTMAGQTYKTGGFGFVFPKGFDMVPDVSRAVLNLRESTDMSDIENKWFGARTCPDSLETPVTDKKLSWKAFLSPFAIAGGIAVSVLVAFCYWKPRDDDNSNNGDGDKSNNGERQAGLGGPPNDPPPQQESTGTASSEPTPSHRNGDGDNSNNGERQADSARPDDGSPGIEDVPASDTGGHTIIEVQARGSTNRA